MIKVNSGEGPEREESNSGNLNLRGNLSNPKRSFSRNVGGKGHSDEVSGGNEEHVIGNGRKVHLCYKVVKNLAGWCSCSRVLWTVELLSDEIGSSVRKFLSHVLKVRLGFS